MSKTKDDLAEYLAEYIEHELDLPVNRATRDACSDVEIRIAPQVATWIIEGIKAFESIFESKINVM